MSSFCEQVVKHRAGIKEKLLSLVLILLFSALEMFFVFFFCISLEYFLLGVAIVVALMAILVLALVLPRINNIEYDYSVLGNALYIDKVINKQSRKRYVKVEIGAIEDFGKLESDSVLRDKYAKKRDCSGNGVEGDYYCVYHEAGRGKSLLIFTPNEKILEGMRPHMNRDLVVKLFYKKNN